MTTLRQLTLIILKARDKVSTQRFDELFGAYQSFEGTHCTVGVARFQAPLLLRIAAAPTSAT